MDKTLELRLINALKTAGMNEGLADAFKEQSDEAVSKFIKSIAPASAPTVEDIIASAAFDKYLEEKGLDGLLASSKKAQSDYDRKVSKSLQTFKKNLLGEREEPGTDPGEGKTGAGSGSDDPVMKMLAELKNEIGSLKAERQTISKMEEAKTLLSKSKLPAKVQSKWLTRIDVNSETTLAEQIEGLESEYTEVFGDVGGGTYKFEQGKTSNGKLSQTETAALAESAKKL